jgi:hypothetical protein
MENGFTTDHTFLFIGDKAKPRPPRQQHFNATARSTALRNGAHLSKYTTLPQTNAHPIARTYWYTPSVCYWYTSSVCYWYTSSVCYWYTSSVWMMRTSSSLRMSATPHTVSIASTCHINQLGRLIITLCDCYTSKISNQRKRRKQLSNSCVV